jgi:hypothetical protein
VGATAILKTLDMGATIDWYTRIGFELQGQFPETGDATWCELARDGVTLQFLAVIPRGPRPPASPARSTSTRAA